MYDPHVLTACQELCYLTFLYIEHLSLDVWIVLELSVLVLFLVKDLILRGVNQRTKSGKEVDCLS